MNLWKMLPPGPELPPWLQMLHWVVRPMALLSDCQRRYGDVFTIRIPTATVVVFSERAAVKEIFTGSAVDLHAGEGNFIVEGLLGSNSLLILDEDRHLRERRLMLPSFHGERMRAYGNAMRGIADRTIDGMPRDRSFPVLPAMQELTLDVILRTVFGMEEGARMERLRVLLRRLLHLSSHPAMIALAYAITPKGLHRLLSWGAQPMRFGRIAVDLKYVLPWGPVSRAYADVDTMLYAEMARRRGTPAGEDILSLLLHARDDAGRAMTDLELRDQMMTLLLAGHETTATSLAWMIHYVLQHPPVLARLQEEIRHAVAPEEAARLEFLDAVINETMRLRPILPIVARKLTRPMTIAGVVLPAGVIVAPCCYLAQRRESTWGADAEAFRPERFQGRRLDPYEFFPFGGGVRRCLGMAFATYEMKLVLAQIFSRLSLTEVEGSRVRPVRRGVTVAPSNGVRVIVKDRSPQAGRMCHNNPAGLARAAVLAGLAGLGLALWLRRRQKGV